MSNRINKQVSKPNQLTQEDLFKWMKLFQACIRQKDYETAKTLFHAECVLFDGEIRTGLSGAEKQWRLDWPSRVLFEFDLQHAAIFRGSPSMFVITTTWSHRGVLVGSELKEGLGTYCLALFERGLLCVHCHNSLIP